MIVPCLRCKLSRITFLCILIQFKWVFETLYSFLPFFYTHQVIANLLERKKFPHVICTVCLLSVVMLYSRSIGVYRSLFLSLLKRFYSYQALHHKYYCYYDFQHKEKLIFYLVNHKLKTSGCGSAALLSYNLPCKCLDRLSWFAEAVY